MTTGSCFAACRQPQVSLVLVIFSSDLPTARFGTDTCLATHFSRLVLKEASDRAGGQTGREEKEKREREKEREEAKGDSDKQREYVVIDG